MGGLREDSLTNPPIVMAQTRLIPVEFVAIILVLVTSVAVHAAAIMAPTCYLKIRELVAVCAGSGSPHLPLLPNSSPLAAEAVKGEPLAVIQTVRVWDWPNVPARLDFALLLLHSLRNPSFV